MVYSNKYVMCVLINGVPQKEPANGVVQIPFGSEYVLRFRNKHDRRAVVEIFIDGENVSNNGYVIQPHSSVDIRRHAAKDVSFKFVSLDSADAVEHGKNGPNPDKVKGTIEARFFLEKKVEPVPAVVHHYYPKPYPWYNPWYGYTWSYNDPCGGGVGGVMGSNNAGNPISTISSCNSENAPTGGGLSSAGTPAPLNDHQKSFLRSCSMKIEENVDNTLMSCSVNPPPKDGCTVEGNATGQTFWSTAIDVEEEYTSVKIFLQGGSIPETKARKPILLCEDDSMPKADVKSLRDLEKENEDLRRKIAEIEGAQLKEKLEKLSKKKK